MPTTSIFSSPGTPDEIGSDSGGTAGLLNGHVLFCQVSAGSTVVSQFDARTYPIGTTTIYDAVSDDNWVCHGTASVVSDETIEVTKYVPEARKSNIIDYDDDGVEQPINSLAVIGEGEGPTGFLEFIQDTQGLIPLWEGKFTVKDDADRLSLLDRANLQLQNNARGSKQYTLTLDPTLDPGIDSTKPGMQVRLVINHRFVQVDDIYWIGKRDVVISPEGQVQIKLEIAKFYGNPAVEGTGEWQVVDGQIIRPDGTEFINAGLNGGVHIGTGGFDGLDPNFERSAGWAWDRYPGVQTTGGSYLRYSDVWPGDANIDDGHEVFPGGTMGPGVYFDQSVELWDYLPDRVYAVTGQRSDDAVQLGIQPSEDHWHCKIYRVCAVLRHGDLSWSDGTWMDSSDTIYQYVDQVDKLERLGLVVGIENHTEMGTNPTMPSSVVSNPTLTYNDPSLTGNTAVIDTLKFYDALCTAFPGAARNIWIGLPNETHTGIRNTTYDDWVVTLVRRIRAKGFTGILVIPTALWAGDLSNLAAGGYDTLMDRLESYDVGYNIVFEWHNYGAKYTAGGSASTYTYAEVDLDLTKVRNGVDGSGRKYALWLSEYGYPLPDALAATGNAAREKEGAKIIASDTYGEPLGIRHKHICPTWWGTGDSTFNWAYPLCYGQTNKGNSSGAGPDPHNSGNGTTTWSGTYPWWDVTTTALRDEWLTPAGRWHWDLAHLIWTS
jgi:Cellulase (glycosyl hydrolase family 5)